MKAKIGWLVRGNYIEDEETAQWLDWQIVWQEPEKYTFVEVIKVVLMEVDD